MAIRNDCPMGLSAICICSDTHSHSHSYSHSHSHSNWRTGNGEWTAGGGIPWPNESPLDDGLSPAFARVLDIKFDDPPPPFPGAFPLFRFSGWFSKRKSDSRRASFAAIAECIFRMRMYLLCPFMPPVIVMNFIPDRWHVCACLDLWGGLSVFQGGRGRLCPNSDRRPFGKLLW